MLAKQLIDRAVNHVSLEEELSVNKQLAKLKRLVKQVRVVYIESRIGPEDEDDIKISKKEFVFQVLPIIKDYLNQGYIINFKSLEAMIKSHGSLHWSYLYLVKDTYK